MADSAIYQGGLQGISVVRNALGARPLDRPTGFEETDEECTPDISPPALGTIVGYHLLSENVKSKNCIFCLIFCCSIEISGPWFVK